MCARLAAAAADHLRRAGVRRLAWVHHRSLPSCHLAAQAARLLPAGELTAFLDAEYAATWPRQARPLAVSHQQAGLLDPACATHLLPFTN